MGILKASNCCRFSVLLHCRNRAIDWRGAECVARGLPASGLLAGCCWKGQSHLSVPLPLLFPPLLPATQSCFFYYSPHQTSWRAYSTTQPGIKLLIFFCPIILVPSTNNEWNQLTGLLKRNSRSLCSGAEEVGKEFTGSQPLWQQAVRSAYLARLCLGNYRNTDWQYLSPSLGKRYRIQKWNWRVFSYPLLKGLVVFNTLKEIPVVLEKSELEQYFTFCPRWAVVSCFAETFGNLVLLTKITGSSLVTLP